MLKALVCGAGGFIGVHLVAALKNEGFFVRGVDIKLPEFSQTGADEFMLLDLRRAADCAAALKNDGSWDYVFQLAADMGGMGFIESEENQILYNSNLINTQMIRAAADANIGRYFFSSSACVYRDMGPQELPLTEDQAYPALPDSGYGFEKLYAERMAMSYGRQYGFEVRIARIINTYGPLGTWRGGREKAPAAICRKVAECPNGGTIDIWGSGDAERSYVFVDDMIDGILLLADSNQQTPVNIDCCENITVNQLVSIIAEVAGKQVRIRPTQGPVGVRARKVSNELIRSLGWQPKYSIKAGIERTYPWIEQQIRQTMAD